MAFAAAVVVVAFVAVSLLASPVIRNGIGCCRRGSSIGFCFASILAWSSRANFLASISLSSSLSTHNLLLDIGSNFFLTLSPANIMLSGACSCDMYY